MDKNRIELTEQDLEAVSAGAVDGMAPKPGLKCPKCRFINSITVSQFLMAGTFACSDCGQQFSVSMTPQLKDALSKTQLTPDSIVMKDTAVKGR